MFFFVESVKKEEVNKRYRLYSMEDYKEKTKVVFVQLGSPKSPTVKHVRPYLREFLSDRRVIDLNPYFWNIILYLFILPFRPKKSASLYKRIWDGTGFPLIKITEKFTAKVRSFLTHPQVEVNHAFLLSDPRIDEVWDDWEKDPNPATKLMAIPMFPQFSESTTLSGVDALAKVAAKRSRFPELQIVTNFHRSIALIDHTVKLIDEHLKVLNQSGKSPDRLLLSFHGIQKRRIKDKGDKYYQHCCETFSLIVERLKEIQPEKVVMTFQSRFGSEEWLTPYTEDTVEELILDGHKNLAIYSPSFVADCLETLDELGTELVEFAHEKGGHMTFIPCLNDRDDWCRDFAKFVEVYATGSLKEREELFYRPNAKFSEEFKKVSDKELKTKSEPLIKEAKSTLKIIFLTIFLDLVGFSIIFPLFPTLAKHYLTVDPDNFFLKAIYGLATNISSQTGGEFSQIVLFGGILGALYSLLQFIAAPMWGSLSDKIGRKPVLLISLFGLMISYVLWFFAGSFSLLILARFLGGIMAGNISTATAVVADITNEKTRSKGMAIIGIGFALGFVIGPALGGILSLIDLTKIYPALQSFGVNPFSMPALLAFLLAVFNIVWVSRKFKESLPPEKRGLSTSERSANPLKIFKPLPYPGVNTVNFGHFLFLAAFSGMEFTLTFLAHERLNYSSLDNAYLFIFIGFILAFVQGGVVRRKASSVGEKKMAIMGLLTLIPGLIIIGFAQSVALLYLGLFFLACGSAMAIPCLTTLVTLYTPATEQGKSVGIFRSLGALARVVGPLAAAFLYYAYGSASPYFIGAVFLLIPIFMILSLPKVPTSES